MKIDKQFSQITRRRFIGGLGASMFTTKAFARIGWSASPELLKAFKAMPHLQDGYASNVVYVLTSPWCPKSPELYEASRGVIESGRLSFAWIPFSGGQPEGSNAVQQIMANPSTAKIIDLFQPIKIGTAKGETPLADKQDYLVATTLESLIIRDTGMGIKTPTLVYSIGSQVRIIPGAIDRSDIEIIADFAT